MAIRRQAVMLRKVASSCHKQSGVIVGLPTIIKLKCFKMLRDILRQLLTESDNVTHDLYRYLALVSIVTGLGLQIYAVVYKGEPFAMMAFGTGIGALFAGVGVALGFKKEKSDVPDSDNK